MPRSRTGALVMALVLASAGLVACLHPPTAAAAKDCCRKQCHHDAGEQRAMDCCRARETPAEHVTAVNTAQPVETVSLVSDTVLPAAASDTVVPAGARAHDPPHVALFLQGCALLL